MKPKKYKLKNIYKINNTIFFTLKRYYSTLNTFNSCLPTPIFTLSNLLDKNQVLSKPNMYSYKAGVYSFINNINGKQYIATESCARDLYLILNEELANRKSNSALQSAILKYGLENFSFCIYEYFTYKDKFTSRKLLTDLERSYIKKFNLKDLYNFMKTATSLEGYKHSEKAILKMV